MSKVTLISKENTELFISFNGTEYRIFSDESIDIDIDSTITESPRVFHIYTKATTKKELTYLILRSPLRIISALINIIIMNIPESWISEICPCIFTLMYPIKPGEQMIIHYTPSQYKEPENKIIYPRIMVNNQVISNLTYRLDGNNILKCFLNYCLKLSSLFCICLFIFVFCILFSWRSFPYWPILLIPCIVLVALLVVKICREYRHYQVIKRKIFNTNLS
jgi:hypothetical protein